MRGSVNDPDETGNVGRKLVKSSTDGTEGLISKSSKVILGTGTSDEDPGQKSCRGLTIQVEDATATTRPVY